MSEAKVYPTNDWKSWHDFMPGSPPTLHIQGKIVFPAPGYSAELVPKSPQGINTTIYLFDLVVTKPDSSTGDEKGRFEEDVSYTEYTDEFYVEINIDPGDVSIQVERVS